MTSNLASEEIANYAQELRREEEKKPPLVNPTTSSGLNLIRFSIELLFFCR
jgi:hypothetical protein